MSRKRKELPLEMVGGVQSSVLIQNMKQKKTRNDTTKPLDWKPGVRGWGRKRRSQNRGGGVASVMNEKGKF